VLAIDHFAWTNRWSAHHPAERLLLAGGLLVLSLVLPPRTGGPLILATASLAATAGAGIPVSVFLRVMAVPAGFLLTSVPMLALSVDLADGVRFAFSADGLATAVSVVLRSLAAVACLALLSLTTPVVDLMMLARRAGLPPVVEELALLIYHMLFGLLERTAAARRAQAARQGYADVRRSVRSLGLLAATVFQRALDRGRRLEIGLAARGYDGALTILSPARPWSRRRLALVLAVLAAVTVAGEALPWTL